MRTFLVNLACVVLGLLLCSNVLAQRSTPDENGRILQTIHFEERDLGNREDLPMHWQKLSGTNLPDYVNGRLSRDLFRSGQNSFRFDLNGGSLIYRYDAKQIKVAAGAHYRVEAWVKTSLLPNARARVTAYFVDIDLRPITSTLTHSALYAATSEQDDWKLLSVELTATSSLKSRDGSGPKDPAYLVIELGLLQPAQYAPSTLGQRSLFAQDIRGSCWWDDVSVSQVPKVMLSTNRPGNIFPRGQDVNLLVRVNDRSTDDLSGQLIIRDASGDVIFQRSGALNLDQTTRGAGGDKQIILPLPELRPGWYSASLIMTSRGVLVGEQALDLVQLADAGPVLGPSSRKPIDDSDETTPLPAFTGVTAPSGYSTDRRFGIVATDLPFDGWAELPDILPYLSAGRVKLAVWNSTGDVQGYDASTFDHLLERLGELAITPTACLVDLPPGIARDLTAIRQSQSLTRGIVTESDAADDASARWSRLLDAPPEVWRPQLSYLISRHAQHLDRWQLGADGTDAFVTNPKMRQVYAEVYKEFAGLMSSPDLAMPWPAWYELDGQMPATVALSVPPSVLPSQLPLYISDLSRTPASLDKTSAPQLSLTLELLDRAQYGRETQIRDLAQRVTYALAGGAKRIDLPLPFNVKRVGDDVVKQPQELLLIMRTLLTTLNNAEYKGKVPIAENVDAFLFDRAGQGIMILWSRGNDPAPKQLPLNLGEKPQRVDLWGNVTPLWKGSGFRGQGSGKTSSAVTTTSLKSDPRNLTPEPRPLNPSPLNPDDVSLDIGPMPVFLIDIDGPAAQLRASVGFDRPLIESSFQPHKRKFQFTNPYKTAISGTFRLKARDGWTIIPSTQTFSLNPGEAYEREVTMELPYNSLAGTKTIDASFELQADKASQFSVPVTLQLGLSDVGLQSLALRDGDDVIVQQLITNYGNTPINYTAFAVLPGSARQERLVTSLGAGRSTIKLYRFPVKKLAPGTMVRSGLKEMVGTRILNDEVPVQ